ncbi:phenylacetic acid degradation protein PaaY, partial [Salmonella enterica subsp. enterica serovar Braenderup]
ARVGMNRVIMDGAAAGEDRNVTDMSSGKGRFQGEATDMPVRAPARVLRKVTIPALQWKRLKTKKYQDLATLCRTGLSETKPLT